MTGDERKKYTRAVNCMFSMPSRFDKAVFPGVRTRYDDFVAHHIDTARIHHASVRNSASSSSGVLSR